MTSEKQPEEGFAWKTSNAAWLAMWRNVCSRMRKKSLHQPRPTILPTLTTNQVLAAPIGRMNPIILSHNQLMHRLVCFTFQRPSPAHPHVNHPVDYIEILKFLQMSAMYLSTQKKKLFSVFLPIPSLLPKVPKVSLHKEAISLNN